MHEQMLRSGGQSDVKPSVLSSQASLVILIVLRGGVGTSGSERGHLHEDQAQEAFDRPVVQKTATSRLAEGHLGSWRPLRVLPLTPTHRRLRSEWCHAQGNWTAVEWNQVVFSGKSRFNLSCDDDRVRVWRPPDERLDPAFA
ncbi:transposable element Tcb1 transposase [Trichonephila clavipes]|nr:transposable element Tcb1 transposase [Trichonephila clavipes]